ncbi:tetratricopeptide repeat protein [Maridesulfovibrio sp.]|uniref:tetratricopeptide repeat protein n=1 Tax=Maridesulfovibrio sp. TaxID=2795000 RepID=UPI002A186B38|nr:tetratricopeptide repeat protein [Maridesulfovibrio sp.]
MRRVLLVSFFLLFWMLNGSAYAASLEKITGKVELCRCNQDFFVQVQIGQEVKIGDVLRTGPDGKAVLRLDAGSTMSFGENSEFRLGGEIEGEKQTLIGTFYRGVLRAILSKREGSYIATPRSLIGIRGTDISLTQKGNAGFYFLDEGRVGVQSESTIAVLDARQMTATYAGRKPLPVFTFSKSSGLSQARDKLSLLTSIEIPPSLKGQAQLNEILARWIINYAHYLADAGKAGDAETALLIAEELTSKQNVKGEVLLQIGGLYFYHLNDVQGALRSYRRIIREYHNTPYYENALYGAIRCFMQLDQQEKAAEYARRYEEVFPDGKHIQGLDSLVR